MIRSMNLLTRPTSEIFIHLAIKDIATIISLTFRSLTLPFVVLAATV